MKDMGIIHCSSAQAIPLIVGKDTVYTHTDIEKVETDNQGNPIDNFWKCHEIQFDKDEYIQYISEKNDANEKNVETLTVAMAEMMGV